MQRGLLLTGGGARAAYQAGALKRIEELSREHGEQLPFEVLVGVSAGSINVAALAANASSFDRACSVMTERWSTISTDKVFSTNLLAIGWAALRWLFDFFLGGIFRRPKPQGRSLVSTAPLEKLLGELLPEGAIAEHLESGILKAVAVSATNFTTGELTSFVQAPRNLTLWKRPKRLARYDCITARHILASTALPFFFPAVRIGDAYYGDGSIRNTAPLSPAIHLNSRRILAIGVRYTSETDEAGPVPDEPVEYPSPVKIAGTMLNSIFLDALEDDRNQLRRINRLIERTQANGPTDGKDRVRLPFRKVECMYLGPSEDLGKLARRHQGKLPRTVRYLLGGLGAKGDGASDFNSYLLFEAEYCRELLELGYNDAVARSDELREFLFGDPAEA